MAKSIKAKNKGGRPKVVLDEQLIKDLLKIQCTKAEIATICKCHVDTLYARYSAILQEGDAEAKSSLRRLQWKSAQAGNIQMQIWLGKQWLGQKDRQPDEVANTVINVTCNEVP